MDKLIKSFIFGAVFGIISELVISRGHHYCLKNWKSCILTATIFNIYGWALLFVTIFLNLFRKLNPIILFILLFVLLIIIECLAGKISYWYHNKKRAWNYSKIMGNFCDGYVSLATTFYFWIFIILYYYFVFPRL